MKKVIFKKDVVEEISWDDLDFDYGYIIGIDPFEEEKMLLTIDDAGTSRILLSGDKCCKRKEECIWYWFDSHEEAVAYVKENLQ